MRLTKQECVERLKKSGCTLFVKGPDKSYFYHHVGTDGKEMHFYCPEVNQVRIENPREGYRKESIFLGAYSPE